MPDDLQILKCDFNNPLHCEAEIRLMRDYMTDKMGGKPPLTDKENQLLIEGLKNHPTTLTLLAVYKDEFVGLTNSFINFATFSVKKFLNIHDVIVSSSYRGKGIGKRLLEENIRIAKEELNCSKITLEVRDDNRIAQQLYASLGFKDSNPPMYFWTKYLQ